MNRITPDIIRNCKQGDTTAFRELLTISNPYVYSVAIRILNNEEDARDAVQDSMIKVWKKLKGFDEKNNYKTWLYRITVHTCFDMLRKKKRDKTIMADEKFWEKMSSSLEEGSGKYRDKSEDLKLIRLLTGKLSPLQKAVFVMSEIMTLEQEEIAEILKIRKSAVKANLYHARQGIKKMMEFKM